jgi:hypothetical protein
MFMNLKITGTLGLVAAFGVAAWLGYPAALAPSLAQDTTKSVTDSSYFFRLTAKYMHGDEPVDFDIVVGCAVRVTAYGDESSSYDAFRDPLFFVKATADGAAVLQIVPDACQGETTDNSQVPGDFLPGAIWFDRKDDFTLGIAYIAEDAFENTKAKLKFLGAAIHPATRKEWEAFQPVNAENLLSPRWFSQIPEPRSPEEIQAHLWDRKKIFEWSPRFDCHGVLRYKLSDPAATELVRQYWPPERPRFWMPGGQEISNLVSSLDALNEAKGPRIATDGQYYRNSFKMYGHRGFPTRSGGGAFDGASGFATEIFPIRVDDGLPWFNPALAIAPTIYRDIELAGGANVGYAYCYHWLRGGWITDEHLPNYFDRVFATRVDGERIRLDGRPGVTAADIPTIFFENDMYVYREFRFGLN